MSGPSRGGGARARTALGRAVALALVLAAAGCGHSRLHVPSSLPAADQVALGTKAVAEGDCYQARPLLSGYLEREPSGDKADEAHYLLGVCGTRDGDWPTAATEFLTVINQFSTSPRVPDAQYQLGVAYWKQSRGSAYDQDYTNRALAQFDHFLALYPDHPRVAEVRALREQARDRLAKKDYENGRLYLKMGYYEPARFYFRIVRESYPGTRWAAAAGLDEARSYAEERQWAQARDALDRLLAASPPADLAREAHELRSEVEKKAGGK